MLNPNVVKNNLHKDMLKHSSTCKLLKQCVLSAFWALTVFCAHDLSCLLAEKPAASFDSDSGTSLLVVPDPFGTLELSNAPGK